MRLRFAPSETCGVGREERRVTVVEQMHIDVVIPASEIKKTLDSWLDENLPMDITMRRGKKKGRKVVCFSIYGSSQETIMAKWEALEKLLNK